MFWRTTVNEYVLACRGLNHLEESRKSRRKNGGKPPLHDDEVKVLRQRLMKAREEEANV